MYEEGLASMVPNIGRENKKVSVHTFNKNKPNKIARAHSPWLEFVEHPPPPFK